MREEQQVNDAVDRYADFVRRLCFLYLKNRQDTEDVFQTVFLKYLLYSGDFESGEHERAWFARVTINCCKDLFKRIFRRRETSLEEAEALAVPPEHREVLDAVLALPEQYRAAVYLHYYESYTAAEIGNLLHKKENTIYTWLSRARKQLGETLGGEENGSTAV